MSVSWNGKLIVDRSKIKPRNYTELIDLTKEIKSEINYHIKHKLQSDNEEIEDAVRRKKEMEIQKMRGFSGDRGERSLLFGWEWDD